MLGAGKSTVEIIIAAKDRTKAAFTKVNAQMTTMKGGAGRLGGAMNTLKGGISSATSSLGSLGAALGPLGIAVAAAAVVMATLGGAAFKASLEFEKAFATIRVGTGATGEALTGLEGSFKTVFTSIPASTADAATAISDLNTRLGLTGEPLEALATQFLNLSRITGTDVAAAISSATRVMHDFDVSVQEQAGALDYLFKVSQSTGLGMTQLGNSMTQYGSVMRQMGFDINESAALLGKFEKEGVNLELVLGSLRQGLAKFSKAGEEPVEALARVSAEIQGMGSVADANALAIETFGARAGPDMAAAIREGRFSITELMSTLDASSETINKAAADTLQFGDKWTLLKNKVMGAIAPIGDVIKNVLGGAMEGLSVAFDVLQKVAGPVLDLIFIKFKILQAFLGGLAGPIIAALAPLKKAFGELTEKFKGGIDVLQILKDVVTIVTGVAREFGKAIGWLVAKALTPFTEQLKADIDMLSAFYDKLGPLKDLIGFVAGGIHDLAESFRDNTEEMKTAMDAVDEMAASLEELEASAVSAPTAILKAWKLAVDAFEEGTGSYKEAVSAIDAETEKLKDQWKIASEEEKGYIEDSIRYLSDKKTALEEQDKVATEYLDNVINGTEKAIEKTKEFIVTIGDTTIEFKGAAAEVLKNADAYEKLQRAAQTLIDLDWSVFTEFEASLPRIDAGLGDMESSFVGLKGILEDNIVELENIKQAVMDISEIAAPFLDAGFLDGIKAIGDFASTLKDAGAAINDFSSLQDVSIEGCINFSRHVHDMVTALEILESQMEDLVPAFGDMDSLITDIADAFLYSGGKVDTFITDFGNQMNSAYSTMEDAGVPFTDFKNLVDSAFDTGSFEYWYKGRWWETQKVDDLTDAIKWMDMAITGSNDSMGEFKTTSEKWEDIDFRYTFERNVADPLIRWADYNYNVKLSMEEVYELMKKPPEEQKKWLDDLMHSEEALTFQMDKQTNALKAQTGQLAKITEALQPYLEFMRTLNELAALSTLSTEELNNGLNSIKDTLINLGAALSTFDLQSVMESLFGTKTTEGGFTGGSAKAFADTMSTYQTQFEIFKKGATTITELVSTILSLTAALKDMRDMSVLSVRDIDEALKKIPVFLDRFVDALALNMSAIKQSLKELDVEWQKHAEEMKATMPSYEDSTAQIGKLVGSLLSLNSALKQLAEMGTISGAEFDAGFKSLMESISNFAVSLAKNVDGLVESLQHLDRVWIANQDTLVPLMRDFMTITTNFYEVANNANAMADAFRDLEKNSGTLEKGFTSLIDFINQVVKSTKEFYTTEAAAELATFIKDVDKVIDAFVDLERDLNDAMDKIKGAISTAVNNIEGKISSLSSLIKSAYEWGANMMGAFIVGMDSMSEQLAAAAIRQAGIVEEYLGASSPTKSGPLSHLDEWPRNLVQSYSGGIEAEMHTLNHSFAALAPNMGAAGPASSTKAVNIHLTQNIGNRSDADYSVAQLRREMIRHEVM